jgi:ABC-type spermidine/putrescine transport system permease subunit II
MLLQIAKINEYKKWIPCHFRVNIVFLLQFLIMPIFIRVLYSFFRGAEKPD